MRKLILIFVLAASLILPCVSGAAAENSDIEGFPPEESILADEILVSEEEMILAEGEAVVLTEDITLAEDTENTINLADETLVFSIEELDTFEDIVEVPVPTEDTVTTEEVFEIHQVSESGLVSAAMFSDFGVYSRVQYSGSFGAQLGEDGRKVYNAMAHAFLTEKSTEEFEIVFDEPYVFAVEDLGYNEENEHLWNHEGAEYLDAAGTIKYHVQSAYDAFVYDSPRAFWVSNFNYKWGITLYLENGYYKRGEIKGITIVPQERYAGAASEADLFDAAVDAVAAEIAAGLPENADKIEIMEEIHDWICLNVEYAENTYAHTAAGVFLKDRAVVCEGYAKAFDILCDEFGIESVLIAGGAKKSDGSVEGHMWNYVNLDGVWYMIDTTWDDQKSYISKRYFLTGNSVEGFNDVIRDERTLYTRFSPSDSEAHTFVLPVLNEYAYPGEWHTWDEGIVVSESVCAQPGQMKYVCTTCKTEKYDEIPMVEHEYGEWKVTKKPGCETTGINSRFCVCGAEETEIIAETGHTWNTEYTVDQELTCEQDGKKSYHCKVCNAINEASVVITRASGHTWDAGTVTVQPGCITAGTKIRSCACGKKETEQVAATGHQWEKEYTTDREATCTAYGTESIHCSKCDAVKEGSSRKTARLEASFSAAELVLKTGQSTNKLKVTGLTGGDYVKSWASGNKNIIEVTGKGKITAKKKTGKTYVFITLANDKYGTTRKYQIPVKVQKKEVKTLQISGLEKTVTLKKGKKYTLNPVRIPFTSKQGFKFSSKKPKIASVSSKGVITAKAAGKTKITVRSGDAKFVITVTVPETATKKLEAKKKVSVKKGKSVTLKVKLVPANSDQGISFISKNKKIAVVNQKGKITGKKKGTTEIIIKSGTVTHTCTVTVK